MLKFRKLSQEKVILSPNHLIPIEYRVMCTSADGQVYTQVFDIEGKTPELCDELFMVETILMPPDLKPINGRPSVSVHLSQLSNLLFCSFDDGVSLMGKFSEKESQMINAIRLNPNENKDKAALFPFFNKFGNVFTNFEDICVDENNFYMAAILQKGGQAADFTVSSNGFGVMLKITKNSIQYQPIFNTTTAKLESFTSFDYTHKGTKSHYLVCMMEDGSLQVTQIGKGIEEEVAQPEPSVSTEATAGNFLNEIENLLKPNQLEDNDPKCVVVNAELLDPRNTNYAVDYMEKTALIDPSQLIYEDEMAKLSGVQPVSNKFSLGQPVTVGVQFSLDKSPLNVKYWKFFVHLLVHYQDEEQE